MKQIPDIVVDTLKVIASREVTRDVHREDRRVYDLGLSDGQQVLAEQVLEQLQEVPVEEEPNA